MRARIRLPRTDEILARERQWKTAWIANTLTTKVGPAGRMDWCEVAPTTWVCNREGFGFKLDWPICDGLPEDTPRTRRSHRRTATDLARVSTGAPRTRAVPPDRS